MILVENAFRLLQQNIQAEAALRCPVTKEPCGVQVDHSKCKSQYYIKVKGQGQQASKSREIIKI